jgi:hypothetical protein
VPSKLPVDLLKIDRSFIQGLPGDHTCMTLIRTIIGLASAFGLLTVAEGVDTAEPFKLLRLVARPHRSNARLPAGLERQWSRIGQNYRHVRAWHCLGDIAEGSFAIPGTVSFIHIQTNLEPLRRDLRELDECAGAVRRIVKKCCTRGPEH